MAGRLVCTEAFHLPQHIIKDSAQISTPIVFFYDASSITTTSPVLPHNKYQARPHLLKVRFLHQLMVAIMDFIVFNGFYLISTILLPIDICELMTPHHIGKFQIVIQSGQLQAGVQTEYTTTNLIVSLFLGQRSTSQRKYLQLLQEQH